MQELKAEKPIESPEGSDPVLRLMDRLAEEGFTTEQGPEWWDEYGEIIYRRPEKLPLTKGETVFIFTRVPDLNERMLRQTSESVVQTYGAKTPCRKRCRSCRPRRSITAWSTTSDVPHNETAHRLHHPHRRRDVHPRDDRPRHQPGVYPNLEDKVGVINPRVEYLQYLLGERRETVNMHRPTVQAMWVAVAVLVVLLVAVGFSFVT